MSRPQFLVLLTRFVIEVDGCFRNLLAQTPSSSKAYKSVEISFGPVRVPQQSTTEGVVWGQRRSRRREGNARGTPHSEYGNSGQKSKRGDCAVGYELNRSDPTIFALVPDSDPIVLSREPEASRPLASTASVASQAPVVAFHSLIVGQVCQRSTPFDNNARQFATLPVCGMSGFPT